MNQKEREAIQTIISQLEVLLGSPKEKGQVKESRNYLECYHVIKNGKPVETNKAYLMKPELNGKYGAWIPKSLIKTLQYTNSTSDDVVHVIFPDDKLWFIENVKWDREVK